MSFACLSAADAGCRPSKVRGAILPQEYTLLRFLSKANFSDTSWSTQTPACDWTGITCNADQAVIHIDWSFDLFATDPPDVHGELLWQHMPRTVMHFEARYQLLSGPVELPDLPPDLQEFDINNNKCDGSLEFTSLPRRIEILVLRNNMFFGTIDLTSLPVAIRTIDLSRNQLCGELNFIKLPASLQRLNLSDNGYIKPDRLPAVVLM